MQSGKPALHLPARDIGNGTPPEPGHDLVAQVRPIDGDGPRLPGTPIAAEDFFGDRLERGLLIADRRNFGSDGIHGQLRSRGPEGVGFGGRFRRTDVLVDEPVCLSLRHEPERRS